MNHLTLGWPRVLVYFSMVVYLAAGAQELGDSAHDQRNAIGAQRKQQTAVYDLAERACYERFATSSCLIDVARQRRAMLADLQRQEALLDTADRQLRAQEQRKSLQARQDEAIAREQALDPLDIERSEQEKRDQQAEKVRQHAAQAQALPGAAAPAVRADQGLTPEQRAANQAAFDRKQAEAARRLAQRKQAGGQATSDDLPLPAPAVSR
ncbi:MAG: hypothetical protein WCK81_04515 [Betaproteobacteria bacterium]